MKLYVVRDRDSSLRLVTNDRLIKNNGKGYWIPEYNNTGIKQLSLDKEMFPEIQWEDTTPTEIMLVNPTCDTIDNEDVQLPGAIEIDAPSEGSPYNIQRSSKITIFVKDISYLEPTEVSHYRTIIHMKNGDEIKAKQSIGRVKQLINTTIP